MLDEIRCNAVDFQTAQMVLERMPEGIKRHVGVDLSKQKCAVCFISAPGDIKEMSSSLGSKSREKLYTLFRSGDLVIMEEASTGTFEIARQLNKQECVVACVINPRSTHIDESNKKHDRNDAFQLAKLILRNPVEELSLESIPSDAEMSQRATVSQYSCLDEMHTMLTNRLTILFHESGFPEAGKGKRLHTKVDRS